MGWFDWNWLADKIAVKLAAQIATKIDAAVVKMEAAVAKIEGLRSDVSRLATKVDALTGKVDAIRDTLDHLGTIDPALLGQVSHLTGQLRVSAVALKAAMARTSPH